MNDLWRNKKVFSNCNEVLEKKTGMCILQKIFDPNFGSIKLIIEYLNLIYH